MLNTNNSGDIKEMKKDELKIVTDKLIIHNTHLKNAYRNNYNMPLRYSLSAIISKDDADNMDKLNSVIEAAVKLGVEKFGNSISNPESPTLPIRDGDDGTTNDVAYSNSYYFTVSSPVKPNVVDHKIRTLYFDEENELDLRYARISITVSPYKMNGRLGISFRLNNVQVFKEKFDASQNLSSPQEDFA